MAAGIGASAVRQEIFLDVVAVGLEQHVGAAQLAYLLLGALDHAMALAGLLIEHLPAAGDLESLLGPGLGLDLGHLALLCGRARGASMGASPADRMLLIRVAAEHSPSPRQP